MMCVCVCRGTHEVCVRVGVYMMCVCVCGVHMMCVCGGTHYVCVGVHMIVCVCGGGGRYT